ncbi:MAG: hypothetical protein Q9M18_02965 [Mariprofundaceae bacterium]|nr:hypothetical protein [Mariprofundaceae bacterium]
MDATVKLDGLDAYLSECCRKYDLQACAVVTSEGKILESAGEFIHDRCLLLLPDYLEMSYQMGALSEMKGVSLVTLSSLNQSEHTIAWRFEAWHGLVLCVLLSLHKIPRHPLLMQHAMTRDIPTLMKPVQGLDV